MKPKKISIELVDKLLVKPKRVVKDVLVRVDKFIISVHFIILDMEKENDVPIIFGRSFLATGDVVIGVREITVTFRVNGEEVTFDSNSIPHHAKDMVGYFIV